MKSILVDQSELMYLKSILERMNYICELKVRLYTEENISYHNLINEKFVHQYCMPDVNVILIIFDCYLISKCHYYYRHSLEDILHSFQENLLLFDRFWKNIRCYYDPIFFCQHLSTNEIILQGKLFPEIM